MNALRMCVRLPGPVLVACAVALACARIAPAADAEILPGDPASKVYTLLGEPRGHIKTERFELLTYDRGRIEIRNGVVTKAELVSTEEARTLVAEEARRRAAYQVQAAAAREKRREEGLALKEKTLADDFFRSSPASAQTAFWKKFQEDYPEISVEAELAAASAATREERRQDQLEARIADLERRLQLAEARADRAEADAESARREVRTVYVPGYVGYPWYGWRTPPPPPHIQPHGTFNRDPSGGITIRVNDTK